METKKYQCYRCSLIIHADCLDDDGNCPICHEKVLERCELDRVCICAQDVSGGIHFCPKCGKPVCRCGSHDVVVWSRITGYLQDVSGFNAAKFAELKDRHRTGNEELYKK